MAVTCRLILTAFMAHMFLACSGILTQFDHANSPVTLGEDRKVYLAQDLKGGRELAKQTELILNAVRKINDVAEAYKPDSSVNSLSMDVKTPEKLKLIINTLTTSEELGKAAKVLWLFKGSLPGNGEGYAYVMERACWMCIEKLAKHSDDEAEYLLYEFREKFAVDGGDRELINDVLDTRPSRLNRSYLKNFRRDDRITTIPAVHEDSRKE